MIYRFGDLELDEAQCQLRRRGVPIPLQPKPFDLLLYLIRARGRVVPKQELLDRLWPDTVVSEHSVVRAVNTLRTALGDRQHALVRSIPRRGYCFAAEVEELEAAAPGPPSDSRGDAPHPPAPSPTATAVAADVFVGRESLLEAVDEAIARGFAGETLALVLEGEAGIGKSRTAEEAARLARTRGGEACFGWCSENETAAPFQPWLQILRDVTHQAAWRRIRRTHPSAAADVEALLRGTPPTQRGEAMPADARFRLFESVAVVLQAAAAHAPLLLVLDDLHAADPSSLRLVEFVTREVRDAPIALLLALRSEEVDAQHPVLPTLAVLARRPRTRRFPLHGLRRDEVGRCLEAWCGRAPEASLLDEVFRRSEGNPFFVRELARWLTEAPHDAGPRPRVPPNVRDVVRRRLQPRSKACAEALRLAAVIGYEFDLDVLLAASPAREPALAALEEAVSARLLEERPSGRRLRFAHALFQECLLEEQSALQRIRTHRAVAAALAHLDGEGDARLAERAHHACAGADAETAEEAVACAIRAAERARAVTAFEEAARLLECALDALALSPGATDARRCGLLLDLGRTRGHAGDAAGADAAWAEAARLAAALGDDAREVWALMGRLGSLPALAPPPIARVRELEEKTAALGEEHAALRLAARARLAPAWSAVGDRARGIRHAEAALREARALDDPPALAHALVLRAGLFDPQEPPANRLDRTEEALRTLAGHESPRILLECRIQRAAACLELGDVEGLRRETSAYGALAARLNQRTPRWFASVQTALLRSLTGDLPGTERAVMEAHAAGRRAGHPDADSYFAIQLTQLRYFQGRLAEMEAPLRRAAESAPALVGLRSALALALAEIGRTKEARRELDALAESGFAHLPHDAGRLSNLSLLALVTARLGHPAHAATIEEKLAPFRERNVCAFVVATNGSAWLFLGLLAACRGHLDRARDALERAVAANRRMGIVPWAAWSEQALAATLLRAGGTDEALRACELARRALETARHCGMTPLEREARQTAHEAERQLSTGVRDEPGRRRGATRSRGSIR